MFGVTFLSVDSNSRKDDASILEYGRYLKLMFVRFFILVFATFFLSLYFSIFHRHSCIILENSYLFYIWPSNFLNYNLINSSSYTMDQKCTFFLMQSLLGGSIIVLLIYQVFSMWWRVDTWLYKPWPTNLFLLLFILFSIMMIFGLTDRNTAFSMNIHEPVLVLVLKVSIINLGFYLTAALSIERLFLYRRSNAEKNRKKI